MKSRAAIAGRFGKLLTNASNEIREESDTLYAIDQQAEEAVTVLSEWLQESQDLQLAQDLAKALEEEHDCQKRLELIQGEAEALRVAVEEKRRVKAEAQSKAEREKEDEEFARKLAADEVKYFESKKQQYEDDEKLCYELEQEEKNRYAESKADFKDDMTDSSSVADSKGEEKEDRSYQEKEDVEPTPALSPRQNRRALRSKEQKQIFDNLPSSHAYKKFDSSSMKDESVVSKIWEKGSVEISEVQNALCISVQLPNIQKLHIGIERDGTVMKIHAKRYVRKSSSAPSSSLAQLFTTDSTQYTAEFILDGRVNVTTKDIYHEYYQESGVLFIYVENICLDRDGTRDGVLGKGKQFLDSMKNNFLRIFGK